MVWLNFSREVEVDVDIELICSKCGGNLEGKRVGAYRGKIDPCGGCHGHFPKTSAREEVIALLEAIEQGEDLDGAKRRAEVYLTQTAPPIAR